MNENVELNINSHVILLITLKRHLSSTLKTKVNYVGKFLKKRTSVKFGNLAVLKKNGKINFLRILWDQTENCVLCGHITKLIPL